VKNEVLDTIFTTKVIAVIRMQESEKITKVIEALIRGGIRCLEITLTVPNALPILKEVSQKIPPKFIIGAGTVLDPETARAAIMAGAQFIVSPNTDLRVIKICKRYSKVIIPGAFTPSEILNSWECGADIVKVFPANFFGSSYFKDLKGPYPDINLMPTGRVTIANAVDYINSGACAVSIGGDLIDKKAIAEDKYNIITEKAKKLLKNISEYKVE
jgi:2-dehydro-3-deoxyphosphogluconate aldolase / (4S)-4-hydroxy-2-oxoglutarate aldolase